MTKEDIGLLADAAGKNKHHFILSLAKLRSSDCGLWRRPRYNLVIESLTFVLPPADVQNARLSIVRLHHGLVKVRQRIQAKKLCINSLLKFESAEF